MAQYDITSLVARIEAAGGTRDQLLAAHTSIQADSAGDVTAWNRTAQGAAYELVERLEGRAATVRRGGPAVTDRQASYIRSLGGQVTDGMTRQQASALIDDLKAGRVPAAAAVTTVRSSLYGQGVRDSRQPGATQYRGATGRHTVQIWDEA